MRQTSARHHTEWLSLVETSGPFVSLPVLLRVFPQGLDAHDPAHVRLLRQAYAEWDGAPAEEAPTPRDRRHPAGLCPTPTTHTLHRAWIDFVLTRTLEFPPELLREGQSLPPGLSVRAAEHGETLRPTLAVVAPEGHPEAGRARLLVGVYPPGQGLDRPVEGLRWRASPATRMMELLHGTGVLQGLVTNGEEWRLVHAPRGEATGFAAWYALLWQEEPLTLRAFRSLLGCGRFFGVPDAETPEGLLRESREDQHEVTAQLGYQVRRAVEVLVASLDRADRDLGRTLLVEVEEKRLYEAALTVMMRLVFLFCAEERGLLVLSGDALYDEAYAVSTLRARLREAADQQGEEVLERRHDAWGRLLATFRLVYAGAHHDQLSLPAYGGTLFDPDRFPFLEGRAGGTSWEREPARPLPVDNRTVLHLLEALQMLQVRLPGGGPAEACRISFRALDVEQIGHVYEGLLDHTALRAAGPVLGLAGTRDREPEVPLEGLEALSAPTPGVATAEDAEDRRGSNNGELLAFLREETGRSESALGNALLGGSGRAPALFEAPGAPAGTLPPRLLAACENDAALAARVLPFAGLLREDSRGAPVVFPAGSLYVTQGSDRRSTGTHYTPRALTEEIVQHTLEPLVYDGPADGRPREAWRLRSARELLDLTVCDPAMGSGAFLVQACRWLAERLAEAWEEVEQQHPGRVVVTPAGDLSTGAAHERPLPREAEERLALARRAVAEHCLYGVDRNPMAVEMAKLSLWLVTLARGKPFTFLDHRLKLGDSLAGTLWHEIRPGVLRPLPTEIPDAAFRSRPLRERNAAERGGQLSTAAAAPAAEDAAAYRRLAEFPDDPEGQRRKEAAYRRLYEDAAARRRSAAADLWAAAWFWDRVEFADPYAPTTGPYRALLERGEAPPPEMTAAVERLRRELPFFHWGLEFPDVAAQGGFDAVVGNPPFQGGQKITGALGTDYRDYLVTALAGGRKGSADLCAYFFLRAARLVRAGGSFGLLATNTLAQGDTREVGLEQLAAAGCEILRAHPSRPWPGQASLEVAVVWARRGPWRGERVLEDKPVPGITPFLTVPGRAAGTPHRLRANAGKSFQGSIVLGMGFVLTPEEAAALIEQDPRNREVLFPYLNGEDLNSRPDQSPSRWVINFRDWPLERAETYPDCLAIVREKVKPERERLGTGDATARDRSRRWWQFARQTMNLYATIAGMERVLALSLVNNHLGFAFCPSGIVFAHKAAVFPLSRFAEFVLVQSHFHYHWAWQYSSTMRTDINYSPSDCFETFPFPTDLTGLEDVGARYHAHRQAIMQERGEGLTKTYNRFHNPKEPAEEIHRLRALHAEMDRAVAAAYGWGDLELGHGFHETKQGVRFTLAEPARREVLDRLLLLNHERYAAEVAQGLHEKGKPRAVGKRAPRATAQGALELE